MLKRRTCVCANKFSKKKKKKKKKNWAKIRRGQPFSLRSER